MRISEIYPSIQGEGPNVGKPTVFVRFGGCNLRCPGWPCDTQHAIDPKYRKEWAVMLPGQLMESTDLVAMTRRITNICLTGGEPFLQGHHDLESYVARLKASGYDVECFSNGALIYPDWAFEAIHFVMDWKLPGSGEQTYTDGRLHNVGHLLLACEERPFSQSIKFTIKDREDYDEAKKIWEQYLQFQNINVFAGIVWDQMTNATLVKWMLDDRLPWRLNVQVHNHIWDRRRRGI